MLESWDGPRTATVTKQFSIREQEASPLCRSKLLLAKSIRHPFAALTFEGENISEKEE
jgi:hypothetical protein